MDRRRPTILDIKPPFWQKKRYFTIFKTMKISDRAIGYFSLLAIVCIIIAVAVGMYRAHHNVIQRAYVDFDELGSLQPEDLVTIRGYTVGTVKSVTWLKDRSRVEIKFSEPVIIREGTQFNNVNYALMGQRRLEIIPSKKGQVLPEDYIHQGHFEPGIAEALRLMEDVNAQLERVREMVHIVAEGDSAHASAPEIFENIMSSVEGILENADKSINAISPKLEEVFDQIETASNTLIDVANKADTAVHTATKAINEKVVQAENLIQTISESSDKINKILADLEASPAMDKLIRSRESVDKVNALIEKVNALIAAIDTKGIKVLDKDGNPVKLITWKNINLVGSTAREKAAERATSGDSLP